MLQSHPIITKVSKCLLSIVYIILLHTSNQQYCLVFGAWYLEVILIVPQIEGIKFCFQKIDLNIIDL